MKDKSETYRLHIGNNRRRSFTPNPTFILPSIACPMQLYIGFPQIYSKQTQMRQKNAMDGSTTNAYRRCSKPTY